MYIYISVCVYDFARKQRSRNTDIRGPSRAFVFARHVGGTLEASATEASMQLLLCVAHALPAAGTECAGCLWPNAVALDPPAV